MSDYCVLCWSEKRQKTSAVTEVHDEPLCAFHAKLAGWQEPAAPTAVESAKCHCGKLARHKGRCIGSKSFKDLLPAFINLRDEGLASMTGGYAAATMARKLHVSKATIERLAVLAPAPPVDLAQIVVAPIDAASEPEPTEIPDAPPFVTLKVTEAHLDRFWAKLPITEKARIVESLL